MTQIVLNPEQLAQTASVLQSAAGEYQAIGAQVYGCDCGCMPADVAATVDAVTAEVRSALSGIAGGISEQAADLAQRAGIDQNGGFTAVGAAWGGAAATGGQTVVGGGFDIFSEATQPMEIPIGGGFDIFSEATQPSDVIVGGGFDIFSEATQPSDVIVGGGFDIFDQGTSTGGYDLVIGSDFTIGGGGDSMDIIPGSTFEITPTYNMTDSLATLMGMAQANNDPLAMWELANIQNNMNIATEIWTLPDGWGLEYENPMIF